MPLTAVGPPSGASPGASIVYPESDGQPMADNSKQFRWIFVLAGNLSALYHHRDDVFVGGNQFWYPEQGEDEKRAAPDVFVVFGRPKGDRSSYKQWEEDNIPLTVVFEVLSPSNSVPEMIEKHAFYDEHGVEEYYIYDPEKNNLFAYVRGIETLVGVRKVDGFVSARLGIRFDVSGAEMVVYRPDNRRFLTFEELEADRQRERDRADKAEKRAERAERRAERLAELTRKFLRQEASTEEQQELERLLTPPSPPSS
jgi:Uma2 family endonuclease